jgi:hypothetical protein
LIPPYALFFGISRIRVAWKPLFTILLGILLSLGNFLLVWYQPNRFDRVVVFLAPFFTIFATFGILLLAVSVLNIIKGIQSSSWPSVSGTVLFSHIDTLDGYDIDTGVYTTYFPKVSYEYYVDGLKYSSKRVNFGVAGGYGNAKRVISDYPQNKVVNVFYNPKEPGKAILEPGIRVGIFLLLIFFSAFSIGISIIIFTSSLGYL